jgi:hypothetical protein
MTAQEMLNNKYQTLATKLGDLYLQRDRADSQIAKVKAEIDHIEACVPICNQIEMQLKESAQFDTDTVFSGTKGSDGPHPV